MNLLTARRVFPQPGNSALIYDCQRRETGCSPTQKIAGYRDNTMKTSKALAMAVATLMAVLPVTGSAQVLNLPKRAELDSKGIKPLNSEQLALLLTNNTLYHVVPANGFRVPLVYFPDGTRLVRIRGQVLRTNWRIERDMICAESVVLKREVCRSLFRAPDANAVCDEGAPKCDFGLDWAKGNPERLAQ